MKIRGSRTTPTRGAAERRLGGTLPLEQPSLRKAHETCCTDDKVIEHLHVNERKRACFRVAVNASSARLGSATPDGWLCAKITAAALRRNAYFTISRGYTDV
jgi:hypothetical protein